MSQAPRSAAVRRAWCWASSCRPQPCKSGHLIGYGPGSEDAVNADALAWRSTAYPGSSRPRGRDNRAQEVGIVSDIEAYLAPFVRAFASGKQIGIATQRLMSSLDDDLRLGRITRTEAQRIEGVWVRYVRGTAPTMADFDLVVPSISHRLNDRATRLGTHAGAAALGVDGHVRRRQHARLGFHRPFRAHRRGRARSRRGAGRGLLPAGRRLTASP